MNLQKPQNLNENIGQRLALLISYRGTSFQGWQRQPGFSGIQECIEDTILKMTQEKVNLIASGRTDSGVHALGQVAHFTLKNKKWDTHIILKGLNALLPRSVRILDCREAPVLFHSQRTALKKQYGYYIQTGPSFLPHLDPYSWWLYWDLDFDKMKRALSALKGEHDFKAFQASGSSVKTTVRRIEWIDLKPCSIEFPFLNPAEDVSEYLKKFSLMKIEIIGSGFLKQMVRSIVGTAVKVGVGKYNEDIFYQLLKEPNRTKVGPTAPARGLWLERVWYKDLNFFDRTSHLD